MTDMLPSKSPPEDLDYKIDGAGLLTDGETLVEAGSTITVTGATKGVVNFSADDVTVWVSGGTAGELIFINAVLRTTGGRRFARLYVIPFGEPVSIEEAKLHARITTDEDDALIARYIRTAREWVERQTGIALVQRKFVQAYPAWGSYLPLNFGPVIAVDAVEYTAPDGTDQAFDQFALGHGQRVYPRAAWPLLSQHGQARVTYVAGYAEGAAPETLLQAIHVLVTAWYDSRSPDTIPGTAIDLCDSVRTMTL